MRKQSNNNQSKHVKRPIDKVTPSMRHNGESQTLRSATTRLGDPSRSYAVDANVNIYATAEFAVHAADEIAAKETANRLLARFAVHMWAELSDGQSPALQVHADNIEAQVTRIKEGHGIAPSSAIVRRIAAAEMGDLMMGAIRDLILNSDGSFTDCALLRVELPKLLSGQIVDRLWRLYLFAGPAS